MQAILAMDCCSPCAQCAPPNPAPPTNPNLSGFGSPLGVVTPTYIGQIYTDISGTPYAQWNSFGLTNNSWFQVA